MISRADSEKSYLPRLTCSSTDMLLAGVVENNFIILHNDHKVPLSGPYAYYVW